MSSFPPRAWDVRHIADFDTLTVPAPAGSTYHLQALLTAPPCPGREGQFRLLVSGKEHTTISAKVRDIINDPLFEDMLIDCQLQLGSQVTFNLQPIYTPQ